MQADDLVHLGREALVVCSDQCGAAFVSNQCQELAQHAVGSGLVEIAGRLVGEDQRRPIGQRAGNGNALLLSAGKLGWAMIKPLRQAELA